MNMKLKPPILVALLMLLLPISVSVKLVLESNVGNEVVYWNDKTLTGNQMETYESVNIVQTGNTLLLDNATLVLRNVTYILNQSEPAKYQWEVSNNSTIILEDSEIVSEHCFYMFIREFATAEYHNSSSHWAANIFSGNSNGLISVSNLEHVYWVETSAVSLNISDSIINNVEINHGSGTPNITRTPGYTGSETTYDGVTGFSLLIHNSSINGWSFVFSGICTASVENSKINRISTIDNSSVRVLNSSVHYILGFGNSTPIIMNSAVAHADFLGNVRINASGWVNITDSFYLGNGSILNLSQAVFNVKRNFDAWTLEAIRMDNSAIIRRFTIECSDAASNLLVGALVKLLNATELITQATTNSTGIAIIEAPFPRPNRSFVLLATSGANSSMMTLTLTENRFMRFFLAPPLPPLHPFALFFQVPIEPEAHQMTFFDASWSFDIDGYVASYGWDFGDGELGAGAIVNHTYAHAGNYTVTLVVIDNNGLTDSASLIVVVKVRSTIRHFFPPVAPGGGISTRLRQR